MANLNEDVLRYIFDYLPTPLEWIQVSQVCRLWKLAASKQWRRICEINYLISDFKKKLKQDDVKNALVISTEVAHNIIYFAAPFVKVLIGCGYIRGNLTVPVMFGPFLYHVENFNESDTFELLAKNSTDITEIHFDIQTGFFLSDNLSDIFITNKIIKLTIQGLNKMKEYTTDDVEELSLGYHDPHEIKSFEGLYPNLKKLDLEVNCHEVRLDPEQFFSSIFPYVVGVTSFRLHFSTVSQRSVSCKIFLGIAKLSQLENLSIEISSASIVDANFFLTKLVEGCPKLRSVKMLVMKMTEKQLCILLSLPSLESLHVVRVWNFQSLELPEMRNLRELHLEYNIVKWDYTKFCNALKKMPKLEFLRMVVDVTSFVELDPSLRVNQTTELLCQIIVAVASQDKDIVVKEIIFGFNTTRDGNEKLSILRKIATSLENCTLNIRMDAHPVRVGFLEGIKTFVEGNLESHYAVLGYDKEL